jgi:hypothetical protein
MTDNMLRNLVFVSLALGLLGAVGGTLAFIEMMAESQDADQPVTMAGGSLRLRASRDWNYPNPGGGPPYAEYGSNNTVNRIEWACDYNVGDIKTSTFPPSANMSIEITYGDPPNFTDRDRLKFIKNSGQNLRVEADRWNGSSYEPRRKRFLRAFLELGQHPRTPWKATIITSTITNGTWTTGDPVSCPSLPGGDFFLKICMDRNCK